MNKLSILLIALSITITFAALPATISKCDFTTASVASATTAGCFYDATVQTLGTQKYAKFTDATQKAVLTDAATIADTKWVLSFAIKFVDYGTSAVASWNWIGIGDKFLKLDIAAAGAAASQLTLNDQDLAAAGSPTVTVGGAAGSTFLLDKGWHSVLIFGSAANKVKVFIDADAETKYFENGTAAGAITLSASVSITSTTGVTYILDDYTLYTAGTAWTPAAADITAENTRLLATAFRPGLGKMYIPTEGTNAVATATDCKAMTGNTLVAALIDANSNEYGLCLCAASTAAAPPLTSVAKSQYGTTPPTTITSDQCVKCEKCADHSATAADAGSCAARATALTAAEVTDFTTKPPQMYACTAPTNTAKEGCADASRDKASTPNTCACKAGYKEPAAFAKACDKDPVNPPAACVPGLGTNKDCTSCPEPFKTDLAATVCKDWHACVPDAAIDWTKVTDAAPANGKSSSVKDMVCQIKSGTGLVQTCTVSNTTSGVGKFSGSGLDCKHGCHLTTGLTGFWNNATDLSKPEAKCVPKACLPGGYEAGDQKTVCTPPAGTGTTTTSGTNTTTAGTNTTTNTSGTTTGTTTTAAGSNSNILVAICLVLMSLVALL